MLLSNTVQFLRSIFLLGDYNTFSQPLQEDNFPPLALLSPFASLFYAYKIIAAKEATVGCSQFRKNFVRGLYVQLKPVGEFSLYYIKELKKRI